MSSPAIVCPFCPLHCDDVKVDPSGRINVACPIAAARFETILERPSPARIADREATWSEVAQHVAKLAAEPQGRRIGTAGTTLSVSRALSQLRQAGRITLAVEESPTQSAIGTAISRDGMMAATLGDVKKHADLVWIIGNVQTQLPRLSERLGLLATAANTVKPVTITTTRLGISELAQLAYHLRTGEPVDDAAIMQTATALSEARYAAIVLAADAFEASEALAAAELLLDVVARLNRASETGSRRSVLVSMSAASTLRSVVGWQTNETLPTADAGVAIRLGDPIADSQRVAVQVGGCDPGPTLAGAYLPTSVAGVHCDDVVIRGDGTVTLPLRQIADTELPSLTQWLQSLA